MTPKTTTQNLLLWGAALGVSLLLAFLSGVATHWPDGGPIDWRDVWLGVIQVALAELPIVAAGWGLPRLGKEPIAALVSEVGHTQARAALEVAAIKQETGVSTTLTDADVERIARRGLDMLREDRAERTAERTANDDPADHIVSLIDRAEARKPETGI